MPEQARPEQRPDRLGMRQALLGLGDQMQTALDAAIGNTQRLIAQCEGPEISQVVIAGMGGSGIAGDITRAIAEGVCPLPISVVKGYECPASVGAHSLVVALSFSGNTEETLAVAQAAKVAGAKVVAVTAGGTLGELAQAWGATCYKIDDTIPMPRAAVGALAVPPLIALSTLGLLEGAQPAVQQQVTEAIAQVTKRLAAIDAALPKLPTEGTAASTLIHVCGAGGLGVAAALRWKTQINENSKLPALLGAVPELCHNELAGWEFSPEAAACVQPYFLRHDYEHPQNQKRFDYYAQALQAAGVKAPVEVVAEGNGPLAQLFDLIVVGDALTLELSWLLGRDPGPVDILMNLKNYLAS